VTNEDYYQRILDYIRDRSLESRVTVIPGLEANSRSLADAYHAADVFLLPSIHEPFGIVILEAWAAGLPVIASRVGGIPSFVVPYQDGLLFEPNNNESIVEAFRFLVKNPEDSRNLAVSGQKKARNEYSWDVITDRLVDIYEEALRENPFRE
jgi:glycosyltransferase involved in cell wall biosynthesis